MIEGPEDEYDLSYFLVNGCKEIKDLEKGIPIDPVLLLTKTDNNKQVYKASF